MEDHLVADVRALVYAYLTYTDLEKFAHEPLFTEICQRVREIVVDDEKVNPAFLLRFSHLERIRGAVVWNRKLNAFVQMFTQVTITRKTCTDWFALLEKVRVRYLRFSVAEMNSAEQMEICTLLLRPGNEFYLKFSQQSPSGLCFRGISFGIYDGGISCTDHIISLLHINNLLHQLTAMKITRIWLSISTVEKLRLLDGSFPPINRMLAIAHQCAFQIQEFGVSQRDVNRCSGYLLWNVHNVAHIWPYKEYPFILPEIAAEADSEENL